jgi:hypothetical protein
MTDPTTDTPTDFPAPESTPEATPDTARVPLANIPDPAAESRKTLNALIAQSGLSRTEWCKQLTVTYHGISRRQLSYLMSGHSVISPEILAGAAQLAYGGAEG